MFHLVELEFYSISVYTPFHFSRTLPLSWVLFTSLTKNICVPESSTIWTCTRDGGWCHHEPLNIYLAAQLRPTHYILSDKIKVVMQGKLFQRCTHLLFCSVLSLGGNVNTRRMLKPDMGSIFHIKKSMKYSGHRKLLRELSK